MILIELGSLVHFRDTGMESPSHARGQLLSNSCLEPMTLRPTGIQEECASIDPRGHMDSSLWSPERRQSRTDRP